MCRGKVISFSTERALGEVELDDGSRFSFSLDQLSTPGLPTAGAAAEVRLGETRRGLGVVWISIASSLERLAETAIFLDAARGRSLVWREATGQAIELPGAYPLAPGDLVTLTLERETAFTVHGAAAEPAPTSIAPRAGTVSPASADAIERRFAERWRRYCLDGARVWNDRRLAWEVRGLGRALAAAGRALPGTSVLRRLLRPVDRGVLASRLGLALGPVATELFADAERRRPHEPALAFTDLGLDLWILHEANDTTASDIFRERPGPVGALRVRPRRHRVRRRRSR